MILKETLQADCSCDESVGFHSAESVKISSTNLRLEKTIALTISTDVLKSYAAILVPPSEGFGSRYLISYEFPLATRSVYLGDLKDIAYQIDHRNEKISRHENMPFCFTKFIIQAFLETTQSLNKPQCHKHFHTIKDDGIIKSPWSLSPIISTLQSLSLFLDELGDRGLPSDTQDADDEDVKTKSDKDDTYKYKIRLRKDEDVEMKDVEVEESDKGEEKVTDVKKEEAEKTSKAKDDNKKSELPSSSSSLSVSSGFGDQFLKLSSDSSLVSTVKDSVDTYISSLLDIPIQHETPQTQSSSVQKIPISVIPKATNLLPIPEIVTETPVSTIIPSPQVTHIISSVQQTPTPIPTPLITIDAPVVTTVVPESNALSAVELRVVKLENGVSELKTGDHSSEALDVLQSHVPTVVDSYLDTKFRDVFQKELQKHTADLIHKFSLQHLLELTKKSTLTVEQESEKSPSDILKIKREQAESQKNPQFTIKSNDKAAL
ncbi:hypothetical protein Tco_1283514 [Tanacetum coccineum]